MKFVPLILAISILAACGDPGAAGSGGNAEVASRDLVPQDAALAGLYNRSCRSCHTVAATGAPLTGDADAWAPRMARGMDAMITSVVEGAGGMPPLGLCSDCDVDEFEALIAFMAQGG